MLKAAQGKLNLYFDIHQNGGQRIEVATVGLSKEEARFSRKTIANCVMERSPDRPDIAVVDLAIEPLDNLEVGAWAAKTNGILSLAKKSLHFELPADGVMGTESHREIYTAILTELLGQGRDSQSVGKPLTHRKFTAISFPARGCFTSGTQRQFRCTCPSNSRSSDLSKFASYRL